MKCGSPTARRAASLPRCAPRRSRAEAVTLDPGLMRLKPEHAAPPQHALGVEVLHMTKRFGSFVALDDVSIKVAPGSFHALLGENGAGKSTLVKCLVGFYRPDHGQIQIDEHEAKIRAPHDAHALGIGMVYQHFTLVPSMTAAENLVMSRADVPAVIRWGEERERLAAFMQTVPFKIPLDRPVSGLAAGEKQKLEILKQLYLSCRFMILDEPTSVLTPSEADEVLGVLKDLTRAGAVTILMITHKFREVMAFADAASVLRRGRLTGGGLIAELDAARLAEMMVGSREIPHANATKLQHTPSEPRLVIKDLVVHDDAGRVAVDRFSLAVRGGEILGIARVSGNVQRAVLARELSERASVLVVANPVFGLDFAAVAEIHDRIVAARNDGAAVLLVSEDLDELLELSDRLTVIFDGRLVYEVASAKAEIPVIGRYMAGHAEAAA